MKRSAGLKQKKPLAPGKGFQSRQEPMNRGTSTLTSKQPMQRASKPIKTRRKTTPIRQSARMEACTIELPHVCNRTPETVVWCHENSYKAGKGMGLKAKDEHGAYGCSACHAVYDGQAPVPAWLTREQVDSHFVDGKQKSRAILRAKGLIKN